MEQLTQLGVGGIVIYLFLQQMFSYLKSRNGHANNENGDFRADREREMGQLIERVNNLNSMKDVISSMQERVGSLAESVQTITALMANELQDVKSRLRRLEGKP